MRAFPSPDLRFGNPLVMLIKQSFSPITTRKLVLDSRTVRTYQFQIAIDLEKR